MLSIKERDFVTAIKALGGRDGYVLLRHVVPNTVASITVIATFAMAIVIISEASLKSSRPRRSGAYTDMGLDAQRGQELYQSRSLADDFPWFGYFYYGIRHQSARRRFEGHLRSKVAQAEIERPRSFQSRRMEWLRKRLTSAAETF